MPDSPSPASFHTAIIMDGNGRWASQRGLPRLAGHRRGAETVRAIVEQSPALGIGTLTLYAFSQDNWQRPRPEVRALMDLFRHTLAEESERCVKQGVRLTVIGRRDRLTATLLAAIARAEHRTAGGKTLLLRIAVDYSGRHSIQSGEVGPDVDLLIRTGGEQRLSDFLLWESAYAELFFEPRLWPEFTTADLRRAIQWFESRHRRFGGLGPSPLGTIGIAPAAAANGPQHRGERWLR